MEEASKEQNSSRSWIDSLIKLAPIIFAMTAATFFLNGRAFRSGYVGHFNLNSTMFDDDIGSLVTISVRAWLDVIVDILGWIAPHSTRAWLTIAGILLVPLALGWPVRLLARVTWAWRFRRRRRRQEKGVRARLYTALDCLVCYGRRNIILRRPPRWLVVLRRMVWGLGFMGYFSNLGLSLVALIMLSLVVPFGRAGAEAAASDQAKHFADEPSVTLESPDGHVDSYKVILCASRFCALYSEAAIVTVPVSAITWGISKVPPEGTAKPSKPTSKATLSRRKGHLGDAPL